MQIDQTKHTTRDEKYGLKLGEFNNTNWDRKV